MDLQTATPVEIDTALAALYRKQIDAEGRISRLASDIHRFAGDRGRQVSRNRRVYELSFTDAETKAREFAASDDYTAKSAQSVLATLDEMRAVIAEAKRETRPMEAERTRRGWSRFFLVTSSDGHVHSSMDCSTCNPRTQYGWLPELSGLTMAEAIAVMDERGSSEILCTVCFPDAPVNRQQKPVEDGLCPGSGTLNYDRKTARLGYYSGNYGVCNHCAEKITVTSTGKMRKHKTAA